MKIDLYTKTVLTIIAIALVCIVFQHVNPVAPVHAAATPDITLHSSSNKTQGYYSNAWIEGHDLTEYNPIPVYIVEDPNKQENTEE